jgi:2-deoxy-D-gluconate 3-dehydrogenase
VAVAARSEKELAETASAIEGRGRRAVAVPTDVTVYTQVETLMERTVATLGRLDIVVNNSGIATVMPLAEMPPEDFRRSLEVNLVGAFNGCRAAAARLIAQKSGKIVNLASMLGAAGLAGYTAYSASKGGVIAFTRALAVEWARHNIQVNAMAPGWFVTDMNSQAFDDPRIRERLLRDVPARRTGKLEEIGPLAVYLASSASDFMTGQTVFLDGGHSAA